MLFAFVGVIGWSLIALGILGLSVVRFVKGEISAGYFLLAVVSCLAMLYILGDTMAELMRMATIALPWAA